MKIGKGLLALFLPLMAYFLFELPVNLGWWKIVESFGAFPSFTWILILNNIPWAIIFLACGAFSRFLVSGRASFFIALVSGLLVAGYKILVIHSEHIMWEWIFFDYALPPICVLLGNLIFAKKLDQEKQTERCD